MKQYEVFKDLVTLRLSRPYRDYDATHSICEYISLNYTNTTLKYLTSSNIYKHHLYGLYNKVYNSRFDYINVKTCQHLHMIDVRFEVFHSCCAKANDDSWLRKVLVFVIYCI